jgi:hypothetical protein
MYSTSSHRHALYDVKELGFFVIVNKCAPKVPAIGKITSGKKHLHDSDVSLPAN